MVLRPFGSRVGLPRVVAARWFTPHPGLPPPLRFIDQLMADKDALGKNCGKLSQELAGAQVGRGDGRYCCHCGRCGACCGT